jgi:hypothetical protein
MTFKPLTDDRGEELLMSYLAAFPAKTSRAPGKVPALKASDLPCGNTWRELSMKYDRATSSLKTHRCLFQEVLPLSSVTLPRWGMMRDGELWERITLPRLTSGTESGLLPSVPTPQARDWKGPSGRSMKGEENDLPAQVKNWPTFAARDHKGANSREHCLNTGTGRKHMDQLPNAVVYGTDKKPTGSLNPDWVEWIMGWPIGWTRLEPIELDERSWETDPADYPGDIPRVATDIQSRAGRLKAIGNGQVPQAAALAWHILTEGTP